ncbi:hypothetical protein G7046_g1225 [Stylonectria norvegica]|nr:hypothetical protein G7046_g1225 [Stylonectria norvegica]
MSSPRIYASPYPSTVIRSDESFWQFILRQLIDDTLPDKIILQEHERPEKVITYGDASTIAGFGAAGLRDVLGLTKGKTVLVIGKSSLDWLRVEFAALWAGITAAFGNPMATAHELVHYIDVIDPSVIFCDPGKVMSKVCRGLFPTPSSSGISNDYFFRNQVTPAELESVLLSHFLVTETGVCANWDSALETEVPIGYVNFSPAVVAGDRERALNEVMEYAKERVSRFKRLRGGLFYLETFLRNPTGKLLHRSLPARLETLRNSKL